MFNNLFTLFVHVELSSSFNSPVALIFTAVANLLLHGCTVSVQLYRQGSIKHTQP